MIFVIDKKNNQVAMIAEGDIGFDENKFYKKSFKVSKIQKEQIYQNYKIFFKNNKLVFEKNDLMIAQEKKEAKAQKIEEIKANFDKPDISQKDLTTNVKELINLI